MSAMWFRNVVLLVIAALWATPALATPPSDNPYIGYTVYLSPQYTAEVNAAVASITDATFAAKAAQVARIPTFTWLDAASKVPTLGTYLADALNLQTITGKKYLVQIVIYDLPDRACGYSTLGGEYTIADGGVAKYQQFITAIAAQVSAYPSVRVVAILEPYSLASLVTNLNVAKCSNAANTYLLLVTYALQTLSMPNIYIYIDGGNSGWLGWPANLQPAAQVFSTVLLRAGNNTRTRGLATNVAGYNAYNASTPDPITSGNPNYDEIHYINALAPLLTALKFPAHFIVDQSRSGVQNIRNAWGDWCNIRGAGFGIRPTTNTNSTLVDAIVWAKPGGESDGSSNSSNVRYDPSCTHTDSLVPAPVDTTWFEAYFEALVKAANPSF